MKQHLYKLEDVLNPEHATLSKYSLGHLILEKINPIFNSWVDLTYSDNRSPREVLAQFQKALTRECLVVLEELRKHTEEIQRTRDMSQQKLAQPGSTSAPEGGT